MKLIDADAAIEALTEYGNGRAVYIGVEEAVRRIEQLPSAQLEPSIPLSWFDVQIERLKGLDNAFATLTAMQILGMVKKWSDEQDG